MCSAIEKEAMMDRDRRSVVSGVFAVALISAVATQAAHAQVEETLRIGQIPAQVMAALQARFPEAEIRESTREEEDGVVLYDIEFQQQGRKFEADIKEDGTIDNWEMEIPATDLPEVVMSVVRSKYPESTIQEVMAVTVVKEGNEALEGYEIVLETADATGVEITVAPDGTILEEDTGEPG
jgi:hypothetical protein